jgi:hypothetical protein
MILYIFTWAIWYFEIRQKKFYPPRAKFYWGLAIIFIPFISWIAFYTYGRKEHILNGELFDFKSDLPLPERD